MKKILRRLGLGLLFLPSLGFAATLTLSPSSSSVTVNNTFTVSVLLNTSGTPTYGVDINKIRFNPAQLQVVDSVSGTAGVQIAPGTLMAVTTTNTVDNTAGTVQFSQLADFGTTYNGSGTLATITFRAIAASASSAVTIDFTSGSGTDSNVAGLGSDLLTSVSGGTYTLVSPDTTPPTISSVTASGITTAGATISWTTNEASDTQIDYGTTVAYGSQTALNSSMLLSHSQSLSGLNANTLYHYRVRSTDAAGNLAVSADQTFTTSLGADTTAPTVPTGLASSGITTSQVTLNWNSSVDTAGSGQSSSGLAGYKVYRNGAQIATPAITTYTDSGLSATTLYSYEVASYDNVGNTSNKSTAISVTTASPIPIQRKFVFSLEGAPAGQRTISGTIQYLNSSNALISQAAASTDSTGSATLTLPNGLPGSINVKFIANGYLARISAGIDTTSTSILTVTSSNLPAGDFNNDQLVNSLDFSTMNSNWLSSNATADINKDSIVNSLDFAYLSNNWLQVGQ